MAWKKVSEELNRLHASIVSAYPCDRRQMFGFQVFFVNDNMFTGVYEDSVTLRLNPADREKIQEQYDEIVPFMPMGRTMKEYVLIPEHLLNDLEFCSEWFAKSFDYINALPPKVKKEKN